MKYERLYHKDIYLPQCLIDQSICQQQTTNKYMFTNHLKNRINCYDKSHNHVSAKKICNVLTKLKEHPIIPFEIETRMINGLEIVSKYVIRDKCSEYEDIIIVIRNYKVITAYINDSNDNHNTLNYSKYEKIK